MIGCHASGEPGAVNLHLLFVFLQDIQELEADIIEREACESDAFLVKIFDLEHLILELEELFIAMTGSL